MNLVAGMVVADRFKLQRVLGAGGMGAVWLAYHTGLDVPCAVKFIHEEGATSAELRGRFEREAKAAAQLRSPHVVQILDHGTWEGMPYIAMEYLEGEDLEARLTRQGKLGLQETTAITLQVARALARAHAAGLVHRDLKPANIFLVHDDDREIAKVLDFGIAKSRSVALGNDSKTKTGSVMGTPYYMSPEQAQGTKEVDHRSDLWALAVIVYQCVTGELPFDSSALGDLFVKIIVNPIPVPSSVAEVPPRFDAWWARAAARDPGERFQTAKELAEALGSALGLAVSGNDRSLLSRSTDGGAGRASISDPVSDGGSWPEAAARPRLQTEGPVVAALTAKPVDRGARSWVPQIGGVAALVALGGLAAFLLLRSPAAPQRPIAAETAPVPAPSPPASVVAAPTVTPSASATATAVTPPVVPTSASAAPSAKVPAGKPQGPRVGPVPTAPRTTPGKKPDFGI